VDENLFGPGSGLNKKFVPVNGRNEVIMDSDGMD
jgi:hypothetical protein